MIKLFAFLFFLLSSLSSVKATTAAEAVTPERRAALLNTYERALSAVRIQDYDGLEQILSAHNQDIQEALDLDIVSESLLYHAAFMHSPQFIHLLAEHGIEIGASKAFRRAFHYNNLRFSGIHFHSLYRLQELVSLGLVKLEDLWIIVILFDDKRGFSWLFSQSANIEYRIPTGDQGEFETVLGRCLISRRYDFLDNLLRAGANINAPPKSGYTNLWHLAVTRHEMGLYTFIPMILAGTEDLFAPLYDERFEGENNYKFQYLLKMQDWLLDEIEMRLRENRLDLKAIDRVDARGWTLLDRVCLFIPHGYKNLARRLRSAGLPQNFPLTNAFYLDPLSVMKGMIQSGKYNVNEQPYSDKNLLTILIEKEWVDADIVVFMITKGASVSFPAGFKYPNALSCIFQSRKHPFNAEVLNMIAERLSVEELQEVVKMIRHPRFARDIPQIKYYIDEFIKIIAFKKIRRF